MPLKPSTIRRAAYAFEQRLGGSFSQWKERIRASGETEPQARFILKTILANELCPKLLAVNYSEDQPRDDDGKWSSGGGGGISMHNLAPDKALGGSTGAMLMKDTSTGSKYVVKRGASPEHIQEESLTDHLYGALLPNKTGAPPRHVMVKSDLGPTKVAEYASGFKPLSDLSGADHAKVVSGLKQGAAVDMLLANWDVVGLSADNVGLAGGKVYRIDNGGSLRFRAQGMGKGAAFGDKVGEIDTFRNGMNRQLESVFGSVTDSELAKQITDLSSRVEKAGGMAAVLRDASAKTGIDYDSKLAKTLSARLQHMKTWAAGVMAANYSPDQPRDDQGKWTDGGGGVGSTIGSPDSEQGARTTKREESFGQNKDVNLSLQVYSKNINGELMHRWAVERDGEPELSGDWTKDLASVEKQGNEYFDIQKNYYDSIYPNAGATAAAVSAPKQTGKINDVTNEHDVKYMPIKNPDGPPKEFASIVSGQSESAGGMVYQLKVEDHKFDEIHSGNWTTDKASVEKELEDYVKAHSVESKPSPEATATPGSENINPDKVEVWPNKQATQVVYPGEDIVVAKVEQGTHEYADSNTVYKFSATDLHKGTVVTEGQWTTDKAAAMKQFKDYVKSTGGKIQAEHASFIPPSHIDADSITTTSYLKPVAEGEPGYYIDKATYTDENGKVGTAYRYVKAEDDGTGNDYNPDSTGAGDVGGWYDSEYKAQDQAQEDYNANYNPPEDIQDTPAPDDESSDSGWTSWDHSTEFDDSPTFEGATRFESQDEADTWIEDHGTDYAVSLTDPQHAAVKAYSGSHYADLNNAARNGGKSSSEFIQNTMKALDKAIQAADLPEDVVVWRGIKTDYINADVGDEVVHTSYMSTSMNKDTAQGFASAAIMEIKVPKGFDAAPIKSISQNPNEYEILVKRGVRMRVTDKKVEGGKTIYAMEVLPDAPIKKTKGKAKTKK